jgi:quinol monooxygenase YgiN
VFLSITVTCELLARPGEAKAVIQRAIEQLSIPSQNVVGRHSARLFQRIDDPAHLFYVGEWESREAFEAYRVRAPMPGRPDQFQARPICRLYRRLALFERVMIDIQAAHASIVDGPAETHDVRRNLALAYHRASARGRPGLVTLTIHEALDRPAGLLILSGWEIADAQAPPEIRADQALVEQLQVAGGSVQQFVGRTLIETPES